MKQKICFLCLKSIGNEPFTLLGGNEEGKKEAGICYQSPTSTSSTSSKFWNFAQNYLDISSVADKPFPSKELFCNDCENVVTSLSQLYLELLQAHLRLSSKLGELAKLLECSEGRVSKKFRSLLINSLMEQLGFEKAEYVEELRNLLKNKCKLKATETVPQVRVGRLKTSPKRRGVETLGMNIEDSLIKTESLSFSEEDKEIEEQFHSKRQRFNEGYNSDSSFKPESNYGDVPRSSDSDSDSDWSREEKWKSVTATPPPKSVATSKKPSTKTEDKQLSTSEQELHKCPSPTCSKMYDTAKSLRRHLLTCEQKQSEAKLEEQEAQLPCDQCGKSFSTLQKKKKHFAHAHLGVGISSPCHVCLKVFSSPFKLRRHILSIHGLKRYSCSQCEVETKSKLELEQHMITTNKNDAEVCPQCGIGFTSKAFLTDHINEVHSSSSSEVHSKLPFPCPHCIVGYKIQSKLDTHLLSCSKDKPMYKRSTRTGSRIKWDDVPDANGKFPCSICSKLCSSKLQRQRHIRRVHNWRPLTCEECGVTLKSLYGLGKHMTALHKPKNDICPHCGKTVATGYMRVHIRRVHPELAPTKLVRYPCPNGNCGEGFYIKEKLEKHLGECQEDGGNGRKPS
ncbi:unnamed protein product [Orchesella dallaii]|uniref:C2H2-type domain-containing protein n=1 Tax=Orchesella dallaii TaxID=48710 RepID=A0ABP1RVD9_9HEXA